MRSQQSDGRAEVAQNLLSTVHAASAAEDEPYQSHGE